jgi:quinol-cytochrome oxidoreductase complex cytochrome b subunit
MPIWQGLLLSLGVDLLIPTLLTPWIPLASAFEIASLCALLTLPFIDQHRVQKAISRLRNAHKKGLSSSSATIPLAMVALVLVTVLGKSLALVGASGIVPLLVVTIMLGGALKHAAQAYREGLRDRESLKNNSWTNVQRWEHQLLIVSLIPMLAVRVISLCGALTIIPPANAALRFVFLGTSLLFLLMLKPQRVFFLGSCSRCKQPVPIVISDLGSCLGCDENLRQKFMSRD